MLGGLLSVAGGSGVAKLIGVWLQRGITRCLARLGSLREARRCSRVVPTQTVANIQRAITDGSSSVALMVASLDRLPMLNYAATVFT